MADCGRRIGEFEAKSFNHKIKYTDSLPYLRIMETKDQNRLRSLSRTF